MFKHWLNVIFNNIVQLKCFCFFFICTACPFFFVCLFIWAWNFQRMTSSLCILWKQSKTFKTFSAKSHCKSVLLGCCGLKTLLVSPAGRIDFCYCFNHLSIFMGPLRIFHRVSLVKQCWLDYVANVNRVHDISFLCGLYIFTCYLLSDWIFSNIFFHVTLVTGKIPWASEWIN